jgi:hypothetical protein
MKWILAAVLMATGASTLPARADVVDSCDQIFTLTRPAHPSSSERIAVILRLSGPVTFGAWARATLASGIVDVDLIGTDDLTPLPGYRRVRDVLQDVLGTVGPLPGGIYPIHLHVRHRFSSGVIITTCELEGRVEVAATAAPVVLVDAIEFYNAARDRYFLTADAGEIEYLDRGGEAGWSRTGETFKVFENGHADVRGDSVCRFVSPPVNGLDAHFLTVDYYECLFLQDSPVWFPEPTPFIVGNPDSRTGECADGMVPVYRLWNPRNGDHRLIANAALRARLEDEGWLREGKGPASVAMCAPGR